mmetsp:Transcript_13165/g.30592  ORF Transcript_13165/g.30592 Transcript_13165/m.30592 type:complete len:134 (-) Transcript_13165:730-1131(-)
MRENQNRRPPALPPSLLQDALAEKPQSGRLRRSLQAPCVGASPWEPCWSMASSLCATSSLASTTPPRSQYLLLGSRGLEEAAEEDETLLPSGGRGVSTVVAFDSKEVWEGSGSRVPSNRRVLRMPFMTASNII